MVLEQLDIHLKKKLIYIQPLCLSQNLTQNES